MSQLHLLGERRFWPLFWTQFFGAFNDNVFKNALVILVAYRTVSLMGLDSEMLVVACAGIFILPFFLFSATAGQLADKMEKSQLMRWIKAAEILIMSFAAVGFAIGSVHLLLAVLFLMGLQSSFFGPAKYSIMPELLDERSLVGGNALVGTGTFLAILLGTIVGGLFIAQGEAWIARLGLVVVAVACLGFVSSLFIRRTPAANPELVVALNPVTPSIKILRVTAANRTVFLSVLGISWFWFLGASFLSLLPNFSKDVIGGGEMVVTFFLALFCVGIAVGSLGCERLSRRRLELGLVPLGSIGISVFAFDLAFAGSGWAVPESLLQVGDFLRSPGALRVSVDLFFVAVFSGFYTVPLYTLVQQRSEQRERSRVIAGNNILNALFMVVSSLLLITLLTVGYKIPQIFLVLAVLNGAVAVFIYTVIPEFLLRFVAWTATNLMYRLKVVGENRIPSEGAAVLVCNHVSFADWLLLSAVSARPLRFVMDHNLLKLKRVHFLFRDAKVIPIASASEAPEVLEAAYDRIAAELEDGEIVCLFPEGRVTHDGRLSPFRRGIETIVGRTPVPVVPMAIVGMWGSFFSRRHGPAMSRPFRRFWSRVTVKVGEPVPADEVSAGTLARRVAELGGWEAPEAHEREDEET